VTTIAFKDNILAADTQLTVGDVKLISNDKIKILNKNTTLQQPVILTPLH
jgi:hypothetical protein